MEPTKGKPDFASRLLPELLLYIIRECCDLPNTDFRTYVRRMGKLSSVCRHWRSTILTTPSFWTSVVTSDEPQFPSSELALFLKRAFNARAQIDMSVSLVKGRKADKRSLIEDLAVYHAFFRHLKLSWTLWPPSQTDIFLRFPGVRSLHLDLADSRTMMLDLSQSHHLESLEILSPLRIHVGRTHFRNLTSVTLIGDGHRAAGDVKTTTSEDIVATLYDVLSASSQLRLLHVSHFKSRAAEKINIVPLCCLDLPRIESLTLTDLAPEALSALLHNLHCPTLKSMHVAPYASGPLLDYLADFVARSRDSLERLKVRNVDSRELRRSFRRAPGIRHLTIEGQRYTPELARSIIAELIGLGQSHRRIVAVCPNLESLNLTEFDLSQAYAEMKILRSSRPLSAKSASARSSIAIAHHRCLLSDKLKDPQDDLISFVDCCYI